MAIICSIDRRYHHSTATSPDPILAGTSRGRFAALEPGYRQARCRRMPSITTGAIM
jgi:hypothetical protein